MIMILILIHLGITCQILILTNFFINNYFRNSLDFIYIYIISNQYLIIILVVVFFLGCKITCSGLQKENFTSNRKCILGNCENGFGMVEYEDGFGYYFYSGEFINGKPSGRGIEHKGHLDDGRGNVVISNGHFLPLPQNMKRFRGRKYNLFKQGKYQGMSSSKFGDGSNIKNDGTTGIHISPSGNIFEGKILNGQYHEGTLYVPSENKKYNITTKKEGRYTNIFGTDNKGKKFRFYMNKKTDLNGKLKKTYKTCWSDFEDIM